MSTSDYLPLTSIIPDVPVLPVEVFDQYAALQMAIVDRDGVGHLSDAWDRPGVYILLDPIAEDGSWGVYVGKAPAGVRARLGQHVKHKPTWKRAVAVRRDTTFGFSSAQVGWLEGRLHDLFDAAVDAHLHNKQVPGDETLPTYDIQILELAILPITRLLRLIGYEPATADDLAAPKPGGANRFFGITVSDIIEAGLLAADESLVSTNGAWPASANVNGDGSISYDGDVFATPSAAAMAAKSGGAANGWDFWAVQTNHGKVPLATLRSKYLDLDLS